MPIVQEVENRIFATNFRIYDFDIIDRLGSIDN